MGSALGFKYLVNCLRCQYLTSETTTCVFLIPHEERKCAKEKMCQEIF